MDDQHSCNPFFLRYFGECLRSPRDYLGFGVAMTSILLWMVAQVPQYYKNYKTQQVEALSPWFLAQWLLGDTGNILGCLLTGDQQPTTTYTAMYFVLADLILIFQYIYYGTLHRRHERVYSAMKRYEQQQRHEEEGHVARRRHHRHSAHKRGVVGAPCEDGHGEQVAAGAPASLSHAGMAAGPSTLTKAAGAAASIGAVLTVARTLNAPALGHGAALSAHRSLKGLRRGRPAWVKTAGQACGYVSSVLYLTSRMPQIYMNWQRKSVEGLALLMFLCAVLANLAYGAGILIRAASLQSLLQQAPWIIGSLGTVVLDATILAQFFVYRDKLPAARSDYEEPLLRNV